MVAKEKCFLQKTCPPVPGSNPHIGLEANDKICFPERNFYAKIILESVAKVHNKNYRFNKTRYQWHGEDFNVLAHSA